MPDTPEKLDLQFMNVAADKRRQLRQLFPEVFTESSDTGGNPAELDFDRLKAVLGEHVSLAEEFMGYAYPLEDAPGGQVFISTHSPEFLNAMPLESLFILEKDEGITRVFRAQDDPLVAGLVEAGDHPGYLWNQGIFTGIAHRIAQES